MARMFAGASPGSARRRRLTGALLAAAQLGYAHWFFGNLYEAVVKVPDLLASDNEPSVGQRTPGVLSPGSPVRYYLPGIPVTLGAILAALAAGWDRPGDRRWLAAAAAGTVSGYAVTAYLVRTVILRVIFTDQPVAPAERERLLRTWYRLNAARLAAVGGAWLAVRNTQQPEALSNR